MHLGPPKSTIPRTVQKAKQHSPDPSSRRTIYPPRSPPAKLAPALQGSQSKTTPQLRGRSCRRDADREVVIAAIARPAEAWRQRARQLKLPEPPQGLKSINDSIRRRQSPAFAGDDGFDGKGGGKRCQARRNFKRQVAPSTSEIPSTSSDVSNLVSISTSESRKRRRICGQQYSHSSPQHLLDKLQWRGM